MSTDDVENANRTSLKGDLLLAGKPWIFPKNRKATKREQEEQGWSIVH